MPPEKDGQTHVSRDQSALLSLMHMACELWDTCLWDSHHDEGGVFQLTSPFILRLRYCKAQHTPELSCFLSSSLITSPYVSLLLNQRSQVFGTLEHLWLCRGKSGRQGVWRMIGQRTELREFQKFSASSLSSPRDSSQVETLR